MNSDEDRAQAHREAQQRYYRRKKSECVFYSQELERLRNQVTYLTGQLTEKDNSRAQLQTQLTERNTLISQLQQQLTERNAANTQLQTLLSRCDNQEESRRVGALVEALTGEIQRGQLCLQTINQLNSEKASLGIYRNLLAELNDRYPKILTSFIHELQQPGNSSSYPEINNWAREQFQRIGQNEIRSLEQFRSNAPNQSPIQPNVPVQQIQPVINQPPVQYVQPAIYSDPDFINYINLKRALGIRTKTIRDPANNQQNEYNRLYRRLYNRYRYVPDF